MVPIVNGEGILTCAVRAGVVPSTAGGLARSLHVKLKHAWISHPMSNTTSRDIGITTFKRPGDRPRTQKLVNQATK